MMAGVVFYELGDVNCFEVPTAVEPGNVFAIPHTDLIRYARNDQLEILAVLEDDIKERMETAIAACTTIVPPRKRKLIASSTANKSRPKSALTASIYPAPDALLCLLLRELPAFHPPCR